MSSTPGPGNLDAAAAETTARAEDRRAVNPSMRHGDEAGTASNVRLRSGDRKVQNADNRAKPEKSRGFAPCIDGLVTFRRRTADRQGGLRPEAFVNGRSSRGTGPQTSQGAFSCRKH